jgi:hypothetical protein
MMPHTLAYVVRVSLFVWLLLLDLTGKGGPTSSYATAGIALRVSGALKPHHHDKVEIPLVGIYPLFTKCSIVAAVVLLLLIVTYFVCVSDYRLVFDWIIGFIDT